MDCKQTVLSAEGHALVGEVVLEVIRTLEPRPIAVAGVALGGCSLASAVAQASFSNGPAIDAVYVRKASKEHGSQRMIEGDDRLPPDAPLVVLEDVVTTGGSTLRVLGPLRERPFSLVAVVALIDREEGGAERISESGVTFKSVFTRSELDNP